MAFVFIATPTPGEMVAIDYAMALAQTAASLTRAGIKFVITSRSSALVQRSRNEFVGDFMDRQDATHLLFWDSDIGVPGKTLVRMLQADVDVIGLAYPKKDETGGFVVNNLGAPDKGIARCTTIGAGFLLMRRAAIQRLQAANPNLAYTRNNRVEFAIFDTMITNDRQYISEDFAFCRRWAACGGELWCYLDAHVTHLGQRRWVGNISESITRSRT